ncbi:uncharacterized protein LOC125516399 [Triticum urartu]|uniref:uncharacterized protein LOC125516399 n=1 Tax=Triticum urartu TaxID=4572 RepID=UPI0020435F5C|nr:uncharacterized protein LOC125516399 [Triticum urartu]
MWIVVPAKTSSGFVKVEWFDKSGKEGEEQQIEEERRALVLKVQAILRPFVLKDMKEAVENRVPQKKGVVQNSDAIIVTCSRDNAAKEGARTDSGNCQEVPAEVVGQTDDEGSPNRRTSQLGREVEVTKVITRPRTNDVPISLVGESNPAVLLQVPNSSSPELIFKALRGIPGLARTDILRSYSALIRDDRRFECLMALPMDMRKDWLLMEIGNN